MVYYVMHMTSYVNTTMSYDYYEFLRGSYDSNVMHMTSCATHTISKVMHMISLAMHNISCVIHMMSYVMPTIS